MDVFMHIPMGGMLTGYLINDMVEMGLIEIENFDKTHLGPNSYDMCIGEEIVEVLPNYKIVYPTETINAIDPALPSNTKQYTINSSGTMLLPGHLYLVATRDRIKTDKFIPMVYGRSSCGRIGISCYQTGNFGDIGYNGVLTLQLSVIYPTLIYPFSYLCQVAFETPYGRVGMKYNGKYQNSDGIACAKPDSTIAITEESR